MARKIGKSLVVGAGISGIRTALDLAEFGYGVTLIDSSPDDEKVLVNPAMCQGCVSCAAVSPNGASVLEGFQQQQILEIVDVAIG